MSNTQDTYDLGELDAAYDLSTAGPRRAGRPRVAPRIGPPTHPVQEAHSALPATVSLAVPGGGHLLLGNWSVGLFFLTATAFLLTLAWAVIATLERLAINLPLLGLPAEFTMWVVGAGLGGAAILHVLSVYTTTPDRTVVPVHPAVPALASLLVPGWGQALNGDRGRAALFLSTLWVVLAAWLLASPAAAQLMDQLDLYLPPAFAWLTTALARWAIPAVVWALAVYDAASSAALRRR